MERLALWLLIVALAHAARPVAARPAMRILAGEAGWGGNLLADPGFEQAAAGQAGAWRAYEQGYSAAPGAGRDGGGAIRCRNADAAGRRGAAQSIVLDQRVARPVRASGWSRAVNVRGRRGGDYSIYVDLIYRDGTPLWGQVAPFSTGTHDWERQEVLILPAQPVERLSVYALFRNMEGEVWFDDLGVEELDVGRAGQFDRLPVQLAGSPPGAPGPTQSISAGELALEYAAGGGPIASLRLGGEETGAPGAPSGFLVRDVAAGSDVFSFKNGECPELDLSLEAALRERDGCVEVSGRVTDRAGRDRAVTLYFALPVEATGWWWHDDGRRRRRIEPAGEFSRTTNVHTGAHGGMSPYPLGCVCGPEHGLALALDMGLPSQYRIAYNGPARVLYIAYDFGLTAETERFPSAAPFRFVIYRFDPEWGFRAAVKRLYELFPDYFACRSRRQGIWMPFTDVSTVEGWQDFGFRYHEGINNVPFDDGAGILSFRYTEPSTWWVAMDPSVPRTHEGVMSVLREAAASENAWRRRHAEAVRVSGSHDANGRPQYLIRDAPWTDGAVFSLNPSPFLPGPSEARMYWNDEVKRRLYGPGAEGEQDGEYLDSLEGYVTADENFRREHFRHATVPLTFCTASKRPCIHKAFSQFEFTRWIARDVHSMGRLTFANGVPSRFTFLCPWLDIMGCEMDWLDGEGNWRPPADAILSLKRTMCYRKPYLILMNTRFDELPPDLVEKYFQRCLFYGIWPSMFSRNASDDPYWQNPDWYNRDRHLFKRYIPLVRRVAEAGWEPVPYAHTGDEAVYVERFGPDEDGGVYLTLLNDSDVERQTVLTVEAGALGLPPDVKARDLIAGGELPVEPAGNALRMHLQMGPEQVRQLHLTTD
jgi:hypothetical protein